MKKLEKRTSLEAVEVRAEADGKRTLVGYASVFNSPADIGGYWVETIAPGAFSNALASDVRALVDHDSGRVIGRTKSGTLRLAEDSKGLLVEIDVPATSDGNDLWVLVERGDISGMSFGFSVTKQTWDETVEPARRTIEEVDLYEVSAVAWPAFDDTTIGKRSLEEWRTTRHIEPITGIQAAAPATRAAQRARLKMDLDLKVRTKR